MEGDNKENKEVKEQQQKADDGKKKLSKEERIAARSQPKVTITAFRYNRFEN